MGPSITQYLTLNESSFEIEPFNEIDSLILSTVSYFYLEHGTTYNEIKDGWVQLPMAICGIPQKKLFGNLWLKDFSCDKFLAALLGSPRYYNTQIGYYEYESSHELQAQFAAMSFLLPNETLYVAFRGTDNSLDGWKEDFNLCFMDSIPSQINAVRYVEKIAESNSGRILVGGHSKGGNLAEYAALLCNESTYDRIDAVYNHDGPAFSYPPCQRFYDDHYNKRLHKTVPESSLVGMLMEQRTNFRIVKANDVYIRQHAPVNWIVDNNSFKYANKLNNEAQKICNSINSWMYSYNPQERKLLIDTLYSVLDSAGLSDPEKTGSESYETLFKLANEIREIDPALRSELTEMLTRVVKIYRNYPSEKKSVAIQRFVPKIPEYAGNALPALPKIMKPKAEKTPTDE